MSKLQELIKELCPDGVEFRKLGEVCEIKRGVRVVKNDLINDGKYPVFQNSLIPLGYYDKNNYPANITFVISAGAAGEIGYTEEPIWAADDCLTIISPNNIINKFIYYCLIANKLFFVSKVRRASVPRLSRTVVDNFEIPIPPLEIQSEIVRILDTFTAHTAELQAELQARKEQYEYYRNKLLTFDENDEGVKWMKLGEIYDMKAGKSIPASEISSVKTEEFQYPCYGGNGLRGYVSIFNQEGEKVLIGRQGALCGNVCFAENLFYATEHAVVVSDKGYCLPRYSFYLLTMMDLNQYKTAGAQPGLSVSRLEKISIPVPPLSEQKRIISILDKFESLVNDLSEGLPAEIAVVQEQYEYYRNKLLTFKRKS